jgi:hypothetical protein
MRKARTWTERERATFCKMVEEGYDSRDIASRFSLNKSCVGYWAQKFGAKIASCKMAITPRGSSMVVRTTDLIADKEMIREIGRKGKAA